QSNQRNARSQQAVLWKELGLPKRQIEIKANPLEVAPHIATPWGIKIERRSRPSLGLEQGAEQKRAKTHHNARLGRKRRDPQYRAVGIGRSEIEPEGEKSRHGVCAFPRAYGTRALTESE